MGGLTFNDFNARIDIQDVLRDAGYQLNRRDGLRYPSYIQLGSDGRRVRGDKFIVTANGKCCFQPPERRNYNVISFIKTFPEKFAEYHPGMSTDRLVNLVCNRLLNQPVVERESVSVGGRREPKPFSIDDYDVHSFDCGDWESQKPFYAFFKNRGIDLATQRAFCGHFFLATKERSNGKKYTNLCFPMTEPAWPGKRIIGMEERSMPNREGKTAYKGIAEGSNAAEGLWIGRLCNGRSDKGFDRPIGGHEDVYWFESAYDAMAFYQLFRDKRQLDDAVFVSTSGNPSLGQMRGMLRETPDSYHHLCFDNDQAGHAFALNFALATDGRGFNSTDVEKLKSEFADMDKFDFDVATNRLNIDTSHLIRHLPEEPYKDWNEQLLGEQHKEVEQEKPHVKR